MQHAVARLLHSRRSAGLAISAAAALSASMAAAPRPDGDPSLIEVSESVQASGGGISQGGDFVVVGSIGQLGGTSMQGQDFEFMSGFLSSEASACVLSDCNCDGTIDGADLGLLLLNWGPCPGPGRCLGDVNGDGNVDGGDLGMLISNWS